MATTIDNYKVKVTVEGGDGIKNLKKDMEGLGEVGGPLGNTINGIISKLGPLGIAASLAGGAFVALGTKALSLAGELSDIAGATGIAAGTLMNFRQSVVEAGGKAEDFGQIAAKLNQSVQEAASGNETFQKSFQNLGVFVTDANGKIRPTGDILQDIISKFQNGELSSKQYAAAIDILGKNINKLELGKLSAIADPIKDEQIKQLDRYNDAIDKLAELVNNKLITSFGKLAIAIDNAFGSTASQRLADLEDEANKRGQTYRMRTEGFLNKPLFGPEAEPLSGQSVPIPERLRDMTEKEKAAYKERQQAAAAHANEMQRQINRASGAQSGRPAAGGGYGATPESVINATKASEKNIAQSRIEQNKQTQLAINSERLSAILMFADQESAITEKTDAQIKDIKINTQAEISKARLDIYSQEKISEQQKANEFGAKEKELRLKEAAEISKARTQMSEAITREQQRIQDIITQSKARVTEEENLNNVIERRNQFLNENSTMTDRERDRAQKLFELEEERLKVLRQIALIKDIPPDERAKRETEINGIYAQRKILTEQQQQADIELQSNFGLGFEKAYRQYAEDSRNAFETAGNLFKTVTRSMEDSIVNFSKTGKFEFKGFVNSIIEELIRSQVRQLIAKTFGGLGGGAGSSGGSVLGSIGKLLGFANGGIIPTNGPVIVGERGPELLVGASGNRVIPNNALGGGSITYNINAVDAMSFKQMLAQDPTFLHAVAEQGRRRMPGAR